jgi:hypothetical protein
MGHSKYGLASLAALMTGGRVSPFPVAAIPVWSTD